MDLAEVPVRVPTGGGWFPGTPGGRTSQANGHDELWIDGRKVGKRYAETLASTRNCMKLGLYRMDSSHGTAETHFDGLPIAASRHLAELG